MNRWEFATLQALPYDAKIQNATLKARSFRDIAEAKGYDICVSIGGLDSLTLYYFLEHVGVHATPVSVSTLEDKSIQRVHDTIPGLIKIKPYKSKVQVLQELGFPVISKAKAAKIANLQKPDNPKQTFIHAIMTGDMGAQGHFEHSNKIKLPDKWLKLFGGLYADHRPDLDCKCAPFNVSADCCAWMKEKPMHDWQKANHMVPYLGLMASEGGQRELGLIKNGCNYFGKSTIRSCPFAPFMRQDILQLALNLRVPVPEIYGTIECREDGILYTTKAQRTGCQMCGFGIHIEKRPHRFDRLYDLNSKEWDFWMKRCCKDPNGTLYGWGRVLDWIGVEWTQESRPREGATY